jgi:hypothetical protein
MAGSLKLTRDGVVIGSVSVTKSDPAPIPGVYQPLPVPTGLPKIVGQSNPAIVSNTEYVDCTFGDFEPANVSNIVFRNATIGYFGLRGPSKLWFVGGSAGRTLPAKPPTYSCDVKGWDGRIPTDICFDGMTFHDMKQTTPGDHVEGLHIYGCNGLALLNCNFVNNDVMQLFIRCGPMNTGSYSTISNVVVRGGNYPVPGAGGFYAIRVAGDGDSLVPKNVVIDRTGMTIATSVSMDPAAVNNGGKVI